MNCVYYDVAVDSCNSDGKCNYRLLTDKPFKGNRKHRDTYKDLFGEKAD